MFAHADKHLRVVSSMFVLLFLSLLATWLDNTSSNTVLQVKQHQDALVLCLHLIKMKQTCLSNTNTAFYHKQLLWCFSKQKEKLKKAAYYYQLLACILEAFEVHTYTVKSIITRLIVNKKCSLLIKTIYTCKHFWWIWFIQIYK